MEYTILLDSVSDIKLFIETVNQYPYRVIAKHDGYLVDAKSIMGLFSLDLTQPITVVFEETEDCISVPEDIQDSLNKLNLI